LTPNAGRVLLAVAACAWATPAFAAGGGTAGDLGGVVLLVVMVGVAYLLAHVVVDRLQRRFLLVTGVEYALLGLLMGPTLTALPVFLDPKPLAPVIALAAGWVGLAFGARFDGSGVRGSIAAAFADGPSPWDQVQVGGFGTSFVPDNARMRQVDVPALAHSDVVAAGWISPSAGVALGGGAELFYSWNLWVQPVEPVEPLDLVGVRWQLGSAPQPIARLPGLSVDVGAAWRMDQPFWPGLDGLRAWAQVRYRP